MRSSSLLLVFLTVALLSVHVSGQAYSPLVWPLSAASSCPAPSSYVKLGNDNYAQFAATSSHPLSSPIVYMSAYDNSIAGAQVTQMSLALGNNAGLAGPVHLRLGLYSMGSNSPTFTTRGYITATLVAQTDELTLYPSNAQTLYANLLTPALLLAGVRYSLAVWADGGFFAGSGGPNISYTGYGSYYEYIDYSLPASMSVFNPGAVAVYGVQTALAASGCVSGAGAAVTNTFAFCALFESYSPAGSTSDYTQVSSTTSVSLSGQLTVTSSTNSSSFGAGQLVSGVVGSASITVSGQDSYYYPYSNANSYTLSLAQLNKVTGVSPSNLVYSSGAAAFIDTNGLSLQLSGGVQLVIQYNSSSAQYQLLNSSSNAAAPTVVSVMDLQSVGSNTQATCIPPQVYTAPTVPSCPAGSMAVTMGDDTADLANTFAIAYDYSYVYGNVLYFRPFLVQVSGTLIQSLSTVLLPNPNVVVHVRLGLFALNGSILSPSWTLLAQGPEQVLVNPVGTRVVVPIQPSVTLAAGTYAVGVWFDQPVYTYYSYWFTNPSPYNLYQSYTSLSASGTMPSFAVPIQDYLLAPSAAEGCVPGKSTLQFSFCAAFMTTVSSTRPDLHTGVLTVLSSPMTGTLGSYWPVLSGNGTRVAANGITSVITLGSITNPTAQRLYNTQSSMGGAALDSVGLQFYYNYYSEEPSLVTFTSAQIPYTPAFSYVETTQYYFNLATNPTVGPGEFSVQPYYGGAVPTCAYVAATYANVVSPASLQTEACATPGLVKISYGDAVIVDFANQKEGNAIPALTVYTNSFTATATVTITQLAVDILSNTAQNLSIQLGLYSASSYQLLGITAIISLQQAFDQQVVAALSTPVQLSVGQYLIGLVSSASLNIATSTSSSPSVAVASFTSGLPSTLSSTVTAAAVPVVAYGCATASYSMCLWSQYYTPAALGGPMSTVYLYQGLLAGTTNADGSFSVAVADVHASSVQRSASTPSSSLLSFAELSLALPSKLFPSSANNPLSAGLSLSSAAAGLTVNLSSTSGSLTETWGLSTLGVNPLQAGVNLSAIGQSGLAVPSCSALSLPSSVSSTPSAPSCPFGQSAVQLGDDLSADYSYNAEEVYYNNNDFLFTAQVTTSSSYVAVTQLGLAINNNFNAVANLAFAVYDSNFNLLSSTNQVTVVNPVDEVAVGTLATPVTLKPNSSYYLVMWSDTSLYSAFTYTTIVPCTPLNYPAVYAPSTWPALFPTTNQYYCGPVPLAAFGCTTAAPASTGSASSSSSAGLSTAVVVGIVVGCVIGTNILLLICLFMLWGLPYYKGRGKAKDTSSQSDCSTDSSHVELAETGSTNSDTAE